MILETNKKLKDYMREKRVSLISIGGKIHTIPKGSGSYFKMYINRLKTKQGCLQIIDDLYGFQEGYYNNYKGDYLHNYSDEDLPEIALEQLIYNYKENQ